MFFRILIMYFSFWVSSNLAFFWYQILNSVIIVLLILNIHHIGVEEGAGVGTDTAISPSSLAA